MSRKNKEKQQSKNKQTEKKPKQLKVMDKAVQDPKTAIEAIKKIPQTEGIMNMENLGKLTGTTDRSITAKYMTWQRISGVEDMMEEIDAL